MTRLIKSARGINCFSSWKRIIRRCGLESIGGSNSVHIASANYGKKH